MGSLAVKEGFEMTVVFIHGVPDTSALWQPIVSALGLREGEYFAPNLPGFGVEWPKQFVPTKDGYADWLLMQIEGLTLRTNQQVDIVGHDWGAIFTQRIASLRPDLVRSWTVIDAIMHPDYIWHKTARRWQTPLLGELMMAISTQKVLGRALYAAGVPREIATRQARHWNGLMKRSILFLYRSAKTVTEEWASELDALPEKGLIIFGGEDPFVDAKFGRQFGEEHGFPVHVVPDRGHWLLLEDPALVADLLRPLLFPKDSLPPQNEVS
ncbi:MAG: alpha/beta hydrolase [Pseudomonadota bacterium]